MSQYRTLSGGDLTLATGKASAPSILDRRTGKRNRLRAGFCTNNHLSCARTGGWGFVLTRAGKRMRHLSGHRFGAVDHLGFGALVLVGAHLAAPVQLAQV